MNKSRQNELVSCDAPPLDFSFKNIRNLEEIKTIQPRQGIRLNPVDEDGKLINASKQQQRAEENQNFEDSQKSQTVKHEKKNQITKLLPQNNIHNLVNNMVNTSAMKNISTKAKQQIEKNKKKSIHVRLICCSLMLCYNRIREIAKFAHVIEVVMPQHKNLQWVDISHNYIEKLDYDFSDYPQLRTLYLHCNFLSDLNDFKILSQRENLKTLSVHGNPLTQIPNFRCYVISMLMNIKKIDSVLVSKKQRDNAIFLRTQVKKFPMPKNAAKPPIQKPEQQQEQKQGI